MNCQVTLAPSVASAIEGRMTEVPCWPSQRTFKFFNNAPQVVHRFELVDVLLVFHGLASSCRRPKINLSPFPVENKSVPISCCPHFLFVFDHISSAIPAEPIPALHLPREGAQKIDPVTFHLCPISLGRKWRQ